MILDAEYSLSQMDYKSTTYKIAKLEMELYKVEGTTLFFKLEDRISRAGTFKYAFRMFPKNQDLAHRQDFCYVHWF